MSSRLRQSQFCTPKHTWNMTETELAASVGRGDVLHFEPRPYLALLFRRIDG